MGTIRKEQIATSNLSTSTTGLAVSGGTNAILGTGVTINADTGYGMPTTTEISAIAHTNRIALDSVSGANTGDETQSTIKTKLGAASGAADGYLTSSNWTTFNGKQDQITAGDLTTTTTGLTVGTGTDAVLGNATINATTGYGIPTTAEISAIAHANRTALDAVSGTNAGDETTTSIKTKLGAASGAADGYLTSGNWSTFNGKQDSLSLPLSIANGGTNFSTALTNDRVMISNAGTIAESSITTDELGLLDGIVSVSQGAGDNDKFVTEGYVNDLVGGGGTFVSLSDVTGAYSTAYAVYRVNATKNGLEELTTFITEPATNQFKVSRGTSDFLVKADCTIDQDLQIVSSPTFTNVTLSVLSNGIVKATAGLLSGGNTVSLSVLSGEVTGLLPLINGGTNSSAALVTAYALHRSNVGATAITETTTVLTEPAANQFKISRGTSDFLVKADCTIDQDLQLSSSPTFANVNVSSGGYHKANNECLAVDAQANHWAIGTTHTKYTTIATAMAAVSGSAPTNIYNFNLTNQLFDEDVTFSTNDYVLINGEATRINGVITSYDDTLVNVFELSKDTADIANFTSGSGQTGNSFLFANKLTAGGNCGIKSYAGTVFAHVNYAQILTNGGAILGHASATAGEINAYIDKAYLYTTSPSVYYIVSTDSASSICSIGNRIIANDAGGSSTLLYNTNGEAYATFNKSSGFDKLLETTSVSDYSGISGITTDGSITASGGDVYVRSVKHSGNITTTTGVLYADIVGYSGTITQGDVTQIVGRIGNNLYSANGTDGFNVMPVGATDTGGMFTFKGASTYTDHQVYVYDSQFRFRTNADDNNCEFRVYNAFTGRTTKIYNDELAGSDGALYANAGYLTRTNPSDERLKENITYMENGDYLDRVLQINPANFTKKISGNDERNFIAQDMLEFFPENVEEEFMPIAQTIDEKGNMNCEFGLRYGLKGYELLYLWKAVQELAAFVGYEIEP